MINLDQSLFQIINQSWTHPLLDSFFPFITDLHKALLFQIIVYPLILVLLILKFKKQGVIIFVCCILCIGFVDFFNGQLIKKNVQRLRPPDNSAIVSIVRSPHGGYSFPSNHAANMAAFAYFICAFVPVMTIPLTLIAFLVSYSRIYNGVHFPFDVLGGALIGVLWASLFVRLCRQAINRLFQEKVSK